MSSCAIVGTESQSQKQSEPVMITTSGEKSAQVQGGPEDAVITRKQRRGFFTSKKTTSQELPEPEAIYTGVQEVKEPISDGTVSPQKNDSI